jgi:TPP-dependent pyruvate/acetoin dehydrogenase alpha subunit
MPSANDIPPEALLELYRTMRRIRRFEEIALYQSTQGKIYGALHLYIGGEAVAAGVCAALERDDYVASTHRGHGHCLAKGARPDRMMAELFGRATGYCEGKGGSMHIADFSCGMLGANGIVGASLGLAAGAALHARIAGKNRVAVAFFGDGAVARGTFHEVLNLAGLWKIPVVFVCENNGYAQWVSIKENLAQTDVAAFAANYAMPGIAIDGTDARAVAMAAGEAVARARAGEGPSLIEARMHRFYGHSLGDMETYRTRDEVADLRRRFDPLARLRREFETAGLFAAAEIDAVDATIEREILDAVAFAEASPFPEAAALYDHVPPARAIGEQADA